MSHNSPWGQEPAQGPARDDPTQPPGQAWTPQLPAGQQPPPAGDTEPVGPRGAGSPPASSPQGTHAPVPPEHLRFAPPGSTAAPPAPKPGAGAYLPPTAPGTGAGGQRRVSRAHGGHPFAAPGLSPFAATGGWASEEFSQAASPFVSPGASTPVATPTSWAPATPYAAPPGGLPLGGAPAGRGSYQPTPGPWLTAHVNPEENLPASPFAIAALATGAVGIPVIPTVLGAAGIRKTNLGEYGGRRMATVGSVLGLVWAVVWMIVGLQAMVKPPQPEPYAVSITPAAASAPARPQSSAGTLPATSAHRVSPVPTTLPIWEVGTCLDGLDGQNGDVAQPVTCWGEHKVEVTATIWLGSRTLTYHDTLVPNLSGDVCLASQTAMFPTSATWSTVESRYIAPTMDDWDNDNAWATCLIVVRDAGRPLTAPLTPSSATPAAVSPAPTLPSATPPAAPTQGGSVGSAAPTPVAPAPGATPLPREPSPSPVADKTGPLRTAPGDFPVGTCFRQTFYSMFPSLTTLPCDGPHAWQVVGYPTINVSQPADAHQQAAAACAALVDGLGLDPARRDTLSILAYVPERLTAAAGDTAVACGIQDSMSLSLVGSALDGTLQ